MHSFDGVTMQEEPVDLSVISFGMVESKSTAWEFIVFSHRSSVCGSCQCGCGCVRVIVCLCDCTRWNFTLNLSNLNGAPSPRWVCLIISRNILHWMWTHRKHHIWRLKLIGKCNSLLFLCSMFFCVYAVLYMCVCVCVCGRERERECICMCALFNWPDSQINVVICFSSRILTHYEPFTSSMLLKRSKMV